MVLVSITYHSGRGTLTTIPAAYQPDESAAIRWADMMMTLLGDAVDYDHGEVATMAVVDGESDAVQYAWDLVDGDWQWVRVLMPVAQ